MIDFLQKNPSVTREQYLWEWSVPQIKLASYDYTHIVSINKKAKGQTFENMNDFLEANNITVLGNKE